MGFDIPFISLFWIFKGFVDLIEYFQGVPDLNFRITSVPLCLNLFYQFINSLHIFTDIALIPCLKSYGEHPFMGPKSSDFRKKNFIGGTRYHPTFVIFSYEIYTLIMSSRLKGLS